MPHLNLEPKYLLDVKSIFKQHAPNIEVWAYGSRVNGDNHDASDLDLVIRNHHNPETPILNLSQLKQAFTDSNLPFLVDLMDWSSLSEPYRNEIERHHLVLIK